MRRYILISLMTVFGLYSCEKDQQIQQQDPNNLLTLKLRQNNKITKLMASNGTGAIWTEEDLKDLDNSNLDVGIVVANIGRKSRNCFGIGICEWFPKPVAAVISEDLPNSSIILPIFDLKEDRTIVITSNNTKEDFVVEDDLTINNISIPKGIYVYNSKENGYVLPVLVKK